MKHLFNLTLQELITELQAMGQQAYRAQQIADWVWHKGVCDFGQMSNLSPGLRDELAKTFCILTGQVVQENQSDDGVVKLLISFPDQQCVECVLIPDGRRLTACLSTQVGCAMGCVFCASGLGGLGRNLTVGEIVEQVFHLQTVCPGRISNVVFMGLGEPLANYAATVSAIRAITDPERLGISARRVTLSTIGFPELIRKLSAEDLPITLAISLHAATDQLRRELIPAASNTSIEDLIRASQDFFASRGRELTLEYLLLDEVNDSVQCAQELAQLARRLRCNVNLIRFNPVAGLNFRRPSEQAVRAFREVLVQSGVNVHIRVSRGSKVHAACGQLRRISPRP
ncbi:MAG: 23S rRNA (adenine(2503)-C(2))-methyltransferase RlmN [Actinobacteria bacterium]|nr:23S rRNA (adenine(2503)-C(2))-methyltransferase RlmN [Actinomycetota bacterium]